jgi:hypothetical protein
MNIGEFDTFVGNGVGEYDVEQLFNTQGQKRCIGG